MVLMARSDPTWKGNWKFTTAQKKHIFERMDREDANGRVTRDEWKRFVDKMCNLREEERKLPSLAHGIFNQDVCDEAVLSFDGDNDGNLEEGEFGNFLDSLATLKLKTVLRGVFSGNVAFVGRGQNWIADLRAEDGVKLEDLKKAAGCSLLGVCHLGSSEGYRSVDADPYGDGPARLYERGCLQIGRDSDLWLEDSEKWWHYRICPRGWAEDLHYFSANHHALHGIFATDPENPLTRQERVAMELAALGWSMFSSLVVKRVARSPLLGIVATQGAGPRELTTHPLFFDFLFVTLPGMIMWRVLYLLFTCPGCGYADPTFASNAQLKQANFKRHVGAAIGYILIFCGIVGLLQCLRTASTDAMLEVITCRVWGYVVSWSILLCVPFNPFLVVGQPDPMRFRESTLPFTIGAWRLQKQRFQGLCVLIAASMEKSEEQEAP